VAIPCRGPFCILIWSKLFSVLSCVKLFFLVCCMELVGEGLPRRILWIALDSIVLYGLQYFELVKSLGPSKRGVKPLNSSAFFSETDRLFKLSRWLKSLLYFMLRGLGGVSYPSSDSSSLSRGMFEHNLLEILFIASMMDGRRAFPSFYLVFSDNGWAG